MPLPEPLSPYELEACDTFADVYGSAALLDHLGLDRLANEFNGLLAANRTLSQVEAALRDEHERRTRIYDSLLLEESKTRKLQHRLDHTGIKGWLHRLRHQVS
jgi:hypothetical protein